MKTCLSLQLQLEDIRIRTTLHSMALFHVSMVVWFLCCYDSKTKNWSVESVIKYKETSERHTERESSHSACSRTPLRITYVLLVCRNVLHRKHDWLFILHLRISVSHWKSCSFCIVLYYLTNNNNPCILWGSDLCVLPSDIIMHLRST